MGAGRSRADILGRISTSGSIQNFEADLFLVYGSGQVSVDHATKFLFTS